MRMWAQSEETGGGVTNPVTLPIGLLESTLKISREVEFDRTPSTSNDKNVCVIPRGALTMRKKEPWSPVSRISEKNIGPSKVATRSFWFKESYYVKASEAKF